MATPVNPLFGARSVDYLRGAVAHYGTVAGAARAIGIARTTLSDAVLGITKHLSTGTVQKLQTFHRGLDDLSRSALQNAADVFQAQAESEKVNVLNALRGDPEGFHQLELLSQEAYHGERKRREAAREPPLESASP